MRQILVEAGADLNTYTDYTYTPLGESIARGHTQISKVRFVLDRVSLGGHLTKILIEAGADLNCVTINGDTPLHLTAMNDRVQVAKVKGTCLTFRLISSTV